MNVSALERLGFSKKQVELFDLAGHAANKGQFLQATTTYKNLFMQVQKSLKLKRTDMPEYIASMYAAAMVQALIREDTYDINIKPNSFKQKDAIERIKTMIGVSNTSFQHRLRNFNTMGFLYMWAGDYSEATQYYKQELATAKSLENKKAEAIAIMNISYARGCGEDIMAYYEERGKLLGYPKEIIYEKFDDPARPLLVLQGGGKLGDSLNDLVSLLSPFAEKWKTIYLDLNNPPLQKLLLERSNFAGINFKPFFEGEHVGEKWHYVDLRSLPALVLDGNDWHYTAHAAWDNEQAKLDEVTELLKGGLYKCHLPKEERKIFIQLTGGDNNPANGYREVDESTLMSGKLVPHLRYLSDHGYSVFTTSEVLYNLMQSKAQLVKIDPLSEYSLLNLVDEIGSCEAVFTIDTGIAHLAGVMGVPSYVIVPKHYHYPLYNQNKYATCSTYHAAVYFNSRVLHQHKAGRVSQESFCRALISHMDCRDPKEIVRGTTSVSEELLQDFDGDSISGHYQCRPMDLGPANSNSPSKMLAFSNPRKPDQIDKHFGGPAEHNALCGMPDSSALEKLNLLAEGMGVLGIPFPIELNPMLADVGGSVLEEAIAIANATSPATCFAINLESPYETPLTNKKESDEQE